MDPNLYVGFSEAAGILPAAIRLFTGGAVNHAFLAWEDERFGGWMALGANANGVTLDAWDAFCAKRTVPALFCPVALPSLWTGLKALRNDLNAKYSIGGLIGMSVVEIARAHHQNCGNPFDKLHGNKLFCSQFALEVIRASGYALLDGYAADTVDPALLMHAIAGDARFEQRSAPKL